MALVSVRESGFGNGANHSSRSFQVGPQERIFKRMLKPRLLWIVGRMRGTHFCVESGMAGRDGAKHSFEEQKT